MNKDIQSTITSDRYDLKFSSLPWTPLRACHYDDNDADCAAN